MDHDVPADGLQLRTLVKDDGTLELSLVRVPTPEPAADEVVLLVGGRVSIGLLFGAADLATLAVSGGG